MFYRLTMSLKHYVCIGTVEQGKAQRKMMQEKTEPGCVLSTSLTQAEVPGASEYLDKNNK